MTLSVKGSILEDLHELIGYNVIGDIQYNYRYIGFKGELSFSAWYKSFRPEDRLYDGGYFVPTTQNAHCYHSSSIYFTISKDDPADYIFIYERLAKLKLKRYYFIKYIHEESFNIWRKIDLLKTGNPISVPRMSIYEFMPDNSLFKITTFKSFRDNYIGVSNYRPANRVPESKKNEWIKKLKIFDKDGLLQLYVQRLIFDGLLGFKVKRGIPSDIDCIVLTAQSILLAIEVKEKDMSKGRIKGFGMDISRIKALRYLDKNAEIPVFYIVRRVASQESREFMEWRIISIRNFINKMDRTAIEGGTGMRSVYSYNPTLLCALDYFVKKD